MDGSNILSNLERQLRTGKNLSMQAVLNSTLVAGGLYTKVITIPDTAFVVRLYPDQILRVALTEAPLAISTATFVIGSIINANEWATIGLDIGLSRTLQLATASTLANVMVEIY